MQASKQADKQAHDVGNGNSIMVAHYGAHYFHSACGDMGLVFFFFFFLLLSLQPLLGIMKGHVCVRRD